MSNDNNCIELYITVFKQSSNETEVREFYEDKKIVSTNTTYTQNKNYLRISLPDNFNSLRINQIKALIKSVAIKRLGENGCFFVDWTTIKLDRDVLLAKKFSNKIFNLAGEVFLLK